MDVIVAVNQNNRTEDRRTPRRVVVQGLRWLKEGNDPVAWPALHNLGGGEVQVI